MRHVFLCLLLSESSPRGSVNSVFVRQHFELCRRGKGRGGGLNTHIPLGRDLCRQADRPTFRQAHRQEKQLGSETGRQVCRAGSETWAEAYMQAGRELDTGTHAD